MKRFGSGVYNCRMRNGNQNISGQTACFTEILKAGAAVEGWPGPPRFFGKTGSGRLPASIQFDFPQFSLISDVF